MLSDTETWAESKCVDWYKIFNMSQELNLGHLCPLASTPPIRHHHDQAAFILQYHDVTNISVKQLFFTVTKEKKSEFNFVFSAMIQIHPLLFQRHLFVESI